MSSSEQKVLQYLSEAHATELGLTRVLQSQIAMTPRGSYRSALESHLAETDDHAGRVARRLQALDQGSNPLMAFFGRAGSVVVQALALGKAPFDLLRGSGGEEKVLKNAKDSCAAEALEIATYTALEHLAKAVGDDETAKLAASIRADEEKMLARVIGELPQLTDAVVRAEIDGKPSYDLATTGAGEAVRAAGTATKVAGRKTAAAVKLGVTSLRGDEPWAGYDELTAAEIEAVLSEGDDDRAQQVEAYEHAHKNRAGVLKAAAREHSNA